MKKEGRQAKLKLEESTKSGSDGAVDGNDIGRPTTPEPQVFKEPKTHTEDLYVQANDKTPRSAKAKTYPRAKPTPKISPVKGRRAGAEKVAERVVLPTKWSEATIADKTLVALKEAGKSWNKIRVEWLKMTGQDSYAIEHQTTPGPQVFKEPRTHTEDLYVQANDKTPRSAKAKTYPRAKPTPKISSVKCLRAGCEVQKIGELGGNEEDTRTSCDRGKDRAATLQRIRELTEQMAIDPAITGSKRPTQSPPSDKAPKRIMKKEDMRAHLATVIAARKEAKVAAAAAQDPIQASGQVIPQGAGPAQQSSADTMDIATVREPFTYKQSP
ncbi:MAG: hypothetical protein Q9182_005748 [Xanthomendoza sp. 2 TL-2023]